MREFRPFPALRILTQALALSMALLASADSAEIRAPAETRPDAEAMTQTATADVEIAAWAKLGDPVLAALIAEALEANTGLRQALARLEMARAAAGAVAADAWPNGGATLRRGAADPAESPWSAGISLGWELDLFGRKASEREAARARAASAEADWRAAQIAVAAELARTWLQWRGAREALALRQRAEDAQAGMVRLTRDLVDLGRAAPGDLARSRAEAAADSAAVQEAQDIVAALEARLAVLVGQKPGHWRAPEPTPLAPLAWHPLAIPDPATLLRARPDVEAAERALAARLADARAAGRARFPRLTLSGLLGFWAGDLAGLADSGVDVRAQGAELAWDILALPRRQARHAEAEAGARLALARYDEVALRAIEETRVALRQHSSASRRLALRLEAASQSRLAADAAVARYEEGAAPYLEALAARRDAISAELGAVEALIGQRIALVDVLRSFGTAPPERRTPG